MYYSMLRTADMTLSDNYFTLVSDQAYLKYITVVRSHSRMRAQGFIGRQTSQVSADTLFSTHSMSPNESLNGTKLSATGPRSNKGQLPFKFCSLFQEGRLYDVIDNYSQK